MAFFSIHIVSTGTVAYSLLYRTYWVHVIVTCRGSVHVNLMEFTGTNDKQSRKKVPLLPFFPTAFLPLSSPRLPRAVIGKSFSVFEKGLLLPLLLSPSSTSLFQKHSLLFLPTYVKPNSCLKALLLYYTICCIRKDPPLIPPIMSLSFPKPSLKQD